MIKIKKKKHSQFHFATMTILLAFLILSFSMSYAVLTQEIVGDKTYSVQVGTFDFEIQGETNAIRLLDAYPMSDNKGQTLSAYIFKLTNTGTITGNYKISLVEAEEQKQLCTDCVFLEPTKLRYSLTIDGKASSPAQVESNTVLDTGTLRAGVSKNYELRLWLNEEVGIEDEGKVYYGKILIEAVQNTDVGIDEVSQIAFAAENLGNACKTYDDGIDTFLVGQCKNNYVWYSGKLWRAVLKNNETGAVKLVTDKAVGGVPYNAYENISFENSYIDQWLNQEFLPTLHDYQDYLVVDSVWDATSDASDTPTRPNGTATVSRTVGLLNAYEYYTTYNNSDELATYSTGYLNYSMYYWLLNSYNELDIRIVNNEGVLSHYNSTYIVSTRPSVNLKSDVQVYLGDGTISNPYRLTGDKKETINGTTLLNTRYSGEYVKFNNELYRIVDIETNLTKITAVNRPNALTNNKFHSEGNTINFASASIKTDLENYYQNNIMESYKAMIEPNTTWYLGTVGSGENYKASICKTGSVTISTRSCEKTDMVATANIGLPRIGEMFTCNIAKENNDPFWTLTPYNATELRNMNNYGVMHAAPATNIFGARPSMYLKSTVRIASNNTGDGTYESPYDIELGE